MKFSDTQGLYSDHMSGVAISRSEYRRKSFSTLRIEPIWRRAIEQNLGQVK